MATEIEWNLPRAIVGIYLIVRRQTTEPSNSGLIGYTCIYTCNNH